MDFQSLLLDAVTKPGIVSEAYRAFHGYSIGNQLSAAFQCQIRGIDFGPIASFKAWQEKGRTVKKGEKAIALCMPVTMKGEKTDKETGDKSEFTFNRFIWRNHWFTISQTEGADFEHDVTSPSWDKALALSALDISETPFDHSDGNCQGYASGRTIAINPVAALPHKTRFHEIAHIVLGHTTEGVMSDSERTPKCIREVEAESVAYIICSILELPGTTECRGYIQTWLSGAEISEKSAQRIFSAADKIMKAGRE